MFIFLDVRHFARHVGAGLNFGGIFPLCRISEIPEEGILFVYHMTYQ